MSTTELKYFASRGRDSTAFSFNEIPHAKVTAGQES